MSKWTRNVIGWILLPAVLLAVCYLPAPLLRAEDYTFSDGKQYTQSYWNNNDGAGYRWDIYSTYGYINSGTNSAYSNGMYLYCNNNGVYSNTRQVSKDGHELLLGPWSNNNITVYRRIYIDPKVGYARWIDIFTNNSGSDQSVPIRYNLNTGYSLKDVKTTTGGESLGKKDWGLVTYPSGSNAPALVHFFATRGAKEKPVLTYNTGNNTMQYNMTLSIPAGETRAVCFFQAQRHPHDKAEKLLESFNLSRELQKVPANLRKILVNMSGPMVTLGSLELPRDAKNDLAVTLAGNEFLGTIINDQYTLKTFYGELSFEPNQVMGLSVPDVNDKHVLLGLVDGQVVAGELTSGPLKLKLPSGSEMTLPTSKLKTIAYRVSKERPEEINTDKPAVVLRSGQQLYVNPEDAACSYLTEYGTVKLDANSMRGVQFDTPDGGLHRVIFRNGSVLSGLVTDRQMRLRLKLGRTLDIRRHLIKSFSLSYTDVDNSKLAQITLRNEDMLFGRVAEEELLIDTPFGEAPLKPQKIETIEFFTRPVGKVKIKLHSGSTIEGKLARNKRTLKFKIEPGPELDVFVGHIVTLSIPKDYAFADKDVDPNEEFVLPNDPNAVDAASSDASDDGSTDGESGGEVDVSSLTDEQRAVMLKRLAAKADQQQKQIAELQASLQTVKARIEKSSRMRRKAIESDGENSALAKKLAAQIAELRATAKKTEARVVDARREIVQVRETMEKLKGG